MITEQQIQDVVQRIVAGYAPEQIILFGSYAYGTPTDDSDLDLLIVKKGENRPLWERMAAVDGLFNRSDAPPLDVLILNTEEAQRQQQGRYSIESFALQNGRRLYGT